MAKRGVTFETAREICAGMAGVEEGTSYGSPAFKVNGKLMACVPSHKSAEAGSLVVSMDFEQRDALLEEMPEAFYLPEHYRSHPYVLVRLGQVDREQLRGGWRRLAGRCKRRGKRKERGVEFERRG